MGGASSANIIGFGEGEAPAKNSQSYNYFSRHQQLIKL
jgi:hypothetical protein